MKNLRIRGKLSPLLKVVGLILVGVLSVGLLVNAAGEGTITFPGGLTIKSAIVHNPRDTNEQYMAYGQVIKSSNPYPEKPPLYELKIEVTQDKPTRAEATIHIFDTLENLSKTPVTYKLYNSGERRKARTRPYATLTIGGAVGFDSYACDPKIDKEDDDPAGALTLTSFGKVDGPITGNLEIKAGWDVPVSCAKLKVGKSATFSVMRAVDYTFD